MSLGDSTLSKTILNDFNNESDDIERSITHSSMCFETIMRLYYLHHGYETPDGNLTHNLMILVYRSFAQADALTSAPTSAPADSVTPEEATSTLILAEIGLYEQSRNYFLPRALFEIVKTEMSGEERDVLNAHTPIQQLNSDTVESRHKWISSQYPVKFTARSVPANAPTQKQLGQVLNEFMASAARYTNNQSVCPRSSEIP